MSTKHRQHGWNGFYDILSKSASTTEFNKNSIKKFSLPILNQSLAICSHPLPSVQQVYYRNIYFISMSSVYKDHSKIIMKKDGTNLQRKNEENSQKLFQNCGLNSLIWLNFLFINKFTVQSCHTVYFLCNYSLPVFSGLTKLRIVFMQIIDMGFHVFLWFPAAEIAFHLQV